jgi:hypothetical protein
LKHAALLLLIGCISGDDVTGALNGYCTARVEHDCVTTTDCCEGWVCAGTVCKQLVPGTCLGTDAGAGSACGCSADCTSNTCSNSVCK